VPRCLANEQTKPHRPRGGARLPMLTICWVAGYSTYVLPVNMSVASAVQSLQSCLRFGEVCTWRGLKLTEPANCIPARMIFCLSPMPAGTLYHYTNQGGLLGIIRDRTIWMTHTQYLNELSTPLIWSGKEINRLQGTTKPETSQAQVLLQLEQALGLSPESINVCVCSFSEEPDSLSQWRGTGRRDSRLDFRRIS
jgi:hypothetical protein